MAKQSFEQLVDVFAEFKSVYISAHVAPDPDAVSSSCGLALGLRTLGISAEVYLQDQIPASLLSLLPEGLIVPELPLETRDAVIVVDTATKARIGADADAFLGLGKKSINIDHHISNESYAELNFIDADSASTSVIILRLLKSLKVEITPEIASLLYAGLSDDTGSFRFSNTTDRSFEDAAELVRLGASPVELANQLYFNVPLRVHRLHAEALAETEFFADGLIGLVVVTQELLNKCSAESDDTEGLIDGIRRIAGVQIAAFLRELGVEDGKGVWKCSLRAKDKEIDVGEIAQRFGGGGHRGAAGATLLGTEKEVRESLVAELLGAL